MGIPEIARDLELVVPRWFDAHRAFCKANGIEDPEATFDALLGKPCSKAQVAALEQALGRPLPPSYRAFLSLYGHRPDLAWDGTVWGPRDHGAKVAREYIERARMLFREFEPDDPFAGGAIPLILGDNRHKVLFVPPVHEDGEMDVVSYDITREASRCRGLLRYFEAELARLMALRTPKKRKKSRR